VVIAHQVEILGAHSDRKINVSPIWIKQPSPTPGWQGDTQQRLVGLAIDLGIARERLACPRFRVTFRSP
jgi:hypothetical protein